MDGSPPRVTVVNDNPEFLDLIRDILADERYVATIIKGEDDDALPRIRASRPDILMIDLRMGSERLHGWDIAKDVRQDATTQDLPILLCTADLEGLREIQAELTNAENTAVLRKPFALDELTAAIDGLLEQGSRT